MKTADPYGDLARVVPYAVNWQIKESPVDAVSRIRRMREVVGPLPDSTVAVRKSRDRLW